MRAVILADGHATRWNDHLGIPKHLARVDGEPIIHRAVRLLREEGVTDVRVVAPPDPRYDGPNHATVRARHNPDWREADKFLSSQHEWSPTERTLVLYGDVYFTKQAIRTIVQHDRRDWTLYGRFGRSALTGGKYAEVFAITFHPQHHTEFRDALLETVRLHLAGVTDRCGGWEAYRVMNGLRGREARHRSPQPKLRRHVEINDWTDDFDRPEEYDGFLARKRSHDALVTVVVPLSITCEHRERAWAYVRERWAKDHPNWPIVVGLCTDLWRKAVAVTNGVHAAPEGSIVIVTDADVWTPGISESVDPVRSGRPWSKPHSRFVRLTEAATERVLAGADLESIGGIATNRAERPYRQTLAGGVVVLPRETALEVPGDPRFTGWGGQDTSWGTALRTLAGAPHVGNLTTYHLWHPPQERVARNVGKPENEALKERYLAARKYPKVMRELIAEGQGT